MLADDPFRVDLRGDSARTVPIRLFSGSQPGLMIAAPGRFGLSPSGASPAPPPGHSRGVLVRCRGKGDASLMTAATTRFSGRACSVQQVTLSREIVRVAALNAPATAAAQRGPSASHSGAATATARTRCAPAPSGSSPNRAVAHSAALPDQVPYGAEAAFAEAKAFLCSREARQMSESDLERELYRRGQELVHKLLQGHLEQRSPREAAGPVDTTAGGEDPARAASPRGETGLGEPGTGAVGGGRRGDAGSRAPGPRAGQALGSRSSLGPRHNSTSSTRAPPTAWTSPWYSTSSTWQAGRYLRRLPAEVRAVSALRPLPRGGLAHCHRRHRRDVPVPRPRPNGVDLRCARLTGVSVAGESPAGRRR